MTAELHEYVISAMESLDCPRSVTLSIMARYGMWRELLELPLSPGDYSDPEAYFLAAQSHAFVKKLDCIPGFGAAERLKTCMEKWWASEHACAKANLRLMPFLLNESSDPAEEAIFGFIARVRKNVVDILGSSPPATWEGHFGPGATVSDNAAHTTVPDKMSSVPTFTTNALYHLVPWSGTLWAASVASIEKSPERVRGNEFFSVPKDSLTDRPCAKEPSINGFYQRGLGIVMAAKLARAGLDLRYGKDRHMQDACEASYNDSAATIDLSSASDTICRNLVKLLLPHGWFEALSALRSPITLVGKKAVFLEKFSSMGNGFTFELETVIFAGIIMACCPGSVLGGDVMVFGDDIIVPVEFYDECVWALRFFGFTPNPKKSFGSGSFRESCGGDYFHGVAVRPHFQEILPYEPQHYLSLANGIRRACQGGNQRARWARLRRVWFRTVDQLPSEIRACRGPEALGDIVLHSPEWRRRWRGQFGFVRVYRPIGPKGRKSLGVETGFSDLAILASAVYGATAFPPWRAIGDRFPDPKQRGWALRGVVGYKLGWVPYS